MTQMQALGGSFTWVVDYCLSEHMITQVRLAQMSPDEVSRLPFPGKTDMGSGPGPQVFMSLETATRFIRLCEDDWKANQLLEAKQMMEEAKRQDHARAMEIANAGGNAGFALARAQSNSPPPSTTTVVPSAGLPEPQKVILKILIKGRDKYDVPEGFLGMASIEISKQITHATKFATGFGEYPALRATATASLTEVDRMQMLRPPFDTSSMSEDVFFRNCCYNTWHATFGHLKAVWLQGYMYEETQTMYSQETIVLQLKSLAKSGDNEPAEFLMRSQQSKMTRHTTGDIKRTREDPKGY